MTGAFRALIGSLLAVFLAAAGAGSAGQLPIPPTPPPEPGSGAVSGVIVDHTTGQPVADAIVAISQRATPVTSQFARQVTDGRGRFVFTGLAGPANYFLSADKSGYFPGGFGRDEPDAPVRPLALADGQWRANVTVWLFRPAVITGTVVDEAGEPVVGTFVRVLARIHVAGQAQFVDGGATQTDDRGVFRLANLRAGDYVVQVPSVQWAAPAGMSALELAGLTAEGVAAAEAAGRPVETRNEPALPVTDGHRLFLGAFPTPPPPSGGRVLTYPTTYFPSARVVDDAAVVSLAPGEARAGVTIALGPMPAFIVSGRIDGPPEALDGLVLRLMPAGSEGLGLGGETATAAIGADGTFVFLNVPPGAYTILAARGIAAYTRDPMSSLAMPVPPGARFASMGSAAVPGVPGGASFVTRTMAGEVFFGRTSIQVADADVTGIEIAMNRGASMSGTIVLEGDSDGRAMPPSGLSAEPAGGEAALGRPTTLLRASPDNPTRPFRIDGLMPGDYFLRPTGFAVKSIEWKGRDYVDSAFDASTGEDFEGIVVTVTARGGRVTGTVREAGGGPSADAAVIIFPVQPAGWRRYGLRPPRIRSATASTAGEYSMSSLPAGDYYLIAVPNARRNAWTDPGFLEAASRVASRVTVEWGAIVTNHLDLKDVRRE
jgi:hypothetical protein